MYVVEGGSAYGEHTEITIWSFLANAGKRTGGTTSQNKPPAITPALSSRNRKLVFRIMDDKDLICSDVSLDSFISGFRLAWQISNQIQNYNGCSDRSQRAGTGVCQLF
ncbi:MAG TPA: hypothetical protein VN446_09250 [Candidatus Acidoferrum sp.]|nr:hypothetical protein [Candidatus Acidoferrum sp.]